MSKGGYSNYMGNPGMPLTKETATTYGGTKPGKAPTVKQPTPPDPFKLIDAQAAANRINTYNPSSSTTYSRNSDGTWNENTSLSPGVQGLYDNLSGSLSGKLNNPSLPNAGDFAEQGKQAQDASYQRAMGLMQPGFDRQNSMLTSQLANQGVMPGSEAYNNAWQPQLQAQNQAQQSAAYQAVDAGNQLQNQLFGQGMASGQQQFSDEALGQNQMFNQMQALLGGAQSPNAPMLDTMTPYQMNYAGQLNNVNATNANSASRNAQTTSAAASGLMALMALL